MVKMKQLDSSPDDINPFEFDDLHPGTSRKIADLLAADFTTHLRSLLLETTASLDIGRESGKVYVDVAMPLDYGESVYWHVPLDEIANDFCEIHRWHEGGYDDEVAKMAAALRACADELDRRVSAGMQEAAANKAAEDEALRKEASLPDGLRALKERRRTMKERRLRTYDG